MRGTWLFTGEDSASARHYKRIELRSVRHQIEHQQQTIALPDGPTVSLRWQAHTGGTFGPRSSAAANQRQRQGRPAPPAPLLDRGQVVAWRCYFRCPCCDRSALVLFNPLWRWREIVSERTIQSGWMCQPCGRFRWPSSRWTGTSSSTGRRPPSHHYQRHQHAADRCLDLLEEGPRWLTERRYMALHQLRAAHLVLAGAACGAAWPGMGSSITAGMIEDAHRTIAACRWATRQRSWERQGKPRPGPAARERLDTE